MNTIKVPRKIQIGIYTYKIKFDKTMMLTTNNVGEHRPFSGEIALAPAMSHTSMVQTLHHEVLHHINSQYKLDFDENTIDRIATGMAEYLERGLGIYLDFSLIKEE